MTRFLRQAAFAFVMMLVAAVALTVAVDPYDYWGSPRIAGLNARRAAANTHLIAVKARQYARVKPRTVVAGNSRVEVGFDPLSRAWPDAAQPVYNYGLAGASFARLVQQLKAAIAVHRPETMLVGIDLIDFRSSEAEWRAWRSAPPRAPDLAERLDTLAQVSLSLTAVGDALNAIPAQRARYGADITRQGWETPGGYQTLVADEGHAALFAQRNRENFRGYRAGAHAVRWPRPGGSAAWAALGRLADMARARHVRLILFTYPYHADILAGFEREGLMPAFLDLRSGLAAFGAKHALEVWDFTRVDARTAEAVPPPGDRHTHLRWYWEAGHFKAALGDRMIAAMTAAGRLPPTSVDSGLNSGGPQPGVADLVGARLTLQTVASSNERLEQQVRALADDPARTARLSPAFAYADRR